MGALHHSLARANGRGSAGQCPASYAAKTPAARESVAPLGRQLDGCDALADATAQLSRQLAELRAVSCAYYEHSDLTRLTREGVEAADQLAKLLGYPNEEMA